MIKMLPVTTMNLVHPLSNSQKDATRGAEQLMFWRRQISVGPFVIFIVHCDFLFPNSCSMFLPISCIFFLFSSTNRWPGAAFAPVEAMSGAHTEPPPQPENHLQENFNRRLSFLTFFIDPLFYVFGFIFNFSRRYRRCRPCGREQPRFAAEKERLPLLLYKDLLRSKFIAYLRPYIVAVKVKRKGLLATKLEEERKERLRRRRILREQWARCERLSESGFTP